MDNLITEVPEALAYCHEVSANLDRYRLFDEERFSSVKGAVMATCASGEDGRPRDPAALEKVIRTVEARDLWITLENNPLLQPAGRALAAKVFHSAQSAQHFVCVVVGLHDLGHFKRFSDVGVDLESLRGRGLAALGDAALTARLTVNPEEIDLSLLRGLVEDAPPTVGRDIEISSDPSAEPLAILGLATSYALLPGAARGGKGGQVEASHGFLRWLKDTLAPALAAGPERMVLYVLTAEHQGCEARFLIPGESTQTVGSALDTMGGPVQGVLEITDRLRDLEVSSVAVAFRDGPSPGWLPRYAITKKAGVICDRPYSSLLDQSRSMPEREERANGKGPPPS